MYRIITVCLGNICRSPMAEAVIRRALRDAGLDGRAAVDSAGTAGYHVGADADPRARAALSTHGLALDHRARRFDPAWLTERDLVLAMDADNLDDLLHLAERAGLQDTGHIRLVRSFDPDAGSRAEVPDPYYGGPEGFDLVLTMLERAADGVVDHVAKSLGSATGPL